MILGMNSGSDGLSDLSLSLTTQVCGVWKTFLQIDVVEWSVVVVAAAAAVVIDDVFVVDCDKLTMSHHHRRPMMTVDMVDVKTA